MHRECSLAVLLALQTGCVDPTDSSYDLDHDDVSAAASYDVCEGFAGGELTGDDLLVLVNKEPQRQLRSDDAPADLVALGPSYFMPGRDGMLRGPAADGLYELIDTAAAEIGVALRVRSAYRSFREQCATYRAKVDENGPEHAARYSALPGRSQHQLGTTVDLTSAGLDWALSPSMGSRAEGEWLSDNAHRFGFALSYPRGAEPITGYAYEPWHFRYVGLAAAAELRNSGLLLDEYLFACAEAEPLRCPREQPGDRPKNRAFIGGHCAGDEDCAGIGAGAFCLDAGTAAASCTLPCSRTCPDRPGLNAPTFCVAVGGSGGLCHSRCDQGLFGQAGCRPSHHCATASRPSPATIADVCLPAQLD